MAIPDQQSREPAVELGTFIEGLEYSTVPSEVVPLVERAFVDTVGVTLAGTAEKAGRTAAAVLAGPGDGPARVLGRNDSASATDAAFANGVAAHALDFDDYTFVPTHPSAPVIAAMTPILDAAGSTDGESLVASYVAGFETICYLSKPLGSEHQEHGWHSTGTLGAFGATGAAAKLLVLDAAEIATAMNVAASMASGLMQNSGSMTKPLHAGNAARAGVTAALLASEGFTADEGGVAGPAGFFTMFMGSKDPDLSELPELGAEWALREKSIGFKKYPACAMLQSGIEAAAQIAAELEVDPTRIEAIDVAASQNTKNVCHYGVPETGLQGKFSMPYAVAVGLLRDHVGLSDFEEEIDLDPETERLCRITTFDVDPDLPYLSTETTVVVTLEGGTRLERTVEYHPGHPENRMSEEEIREKFLMCARRAVDEETANRVYEQLNTLGEQDDAAAVFGGL